MPALEAVVAIPGETGPTDAQADVIAARIRVDLDLLLDRFRATHHDLTGLINRAEFNRILTDRLEWLCSGGRASAPETEPAEPETSRVAEAVGIVAIDVDHFKQVNDTYGHLHGDVVLRAVADRLEAMLRRRGPGYGFEAILAHPSGEEFMILLSGRFTTQQEREFAEQVRAEIASNRVPSDAEWLDLTRGEMSDDAVLPDAVHRRLTVSVGLCSMRGVVDTEMVCQLGFTLRNRAGLALGRAKTGGRDRVVAFDDILMGLGRVLEHHPETDIVAIDLGRSTNDGVGQQFVVYHPTFAGSQPFLSDDGRTKRKLGDADTAAAWFSRAAELTGRIVPEPRDRGYYALAEYDRARALQQQMLEESRSSLPRWQVGHLQRALNEMQAEKVS